jgi:hypothetical protein
LIAAIIFENDGIKIRPDSNFPGIWMMLFAKIQNSNQGMMGSSCIQKFMQVSDGF